MATADTSSYNQLSKVDSYTLEFCDKFSPRVLLPLITSCDVCKRVHQTIFSYCISSIGFCSLCVISRAHNIDNYMLLIIYSETTEVQQWMWRINKDKIILLIAGHN